MGAGLVGAVLNPQWAQLLTPTERLILITMAHTALDPGQRNGRPPAEYWGGHEVLMITVLGELPERNSVAYDNAKKLIQRAIAALVQEGAIVRLSAGRRGHPARYKIILGVSEAVDNLRLLPSSTEVRETSHVPQTGTLMSP